jgi:exosortase J
MSGNGGTNSASVSDEAPAAASPVVLIPDATVRAENDPRSSRLFWACLALLVAAGCVGLTPQWLSLWAIWTTDPLRSIGMLIVPVSVVLTMRDWRQRGWELRGTWWGLVPLAVAYGSNLLSRDLILSWDEGPATLNLIPHILPIYLYFSGVVLLFAGARVWRQAWFPLALLLCAQPVPAFVVHFLDLPLQSLAAHIARSFANVIGFPPSNQELLRLMFAPDFGMFIAPGCDGMRGAVTMGYVALVAGYLKRVSIARWIAYVVGAVILGHVFNLIRLCSLVLYYRLALGHPSLENMAAQADYVIGGILFLIAVLLFFLVIFRRQTTRNVEADYPVPEIPRASPLRNSTWWRAASLAALVILAGIPGVRAIELNRQSLAAAEPSGDLTAEELDARIPDQLGDFNVVSKWQSQVDGVTVMESAAYSKPNSNEITLGIWLRESGHDVHESMMTHGVSPEMRSDISMATAGGRPIMFDTAFYNDGETDQLAGNTYCTPSYCLATVGHKSGLRIEFKKEEDFTTRGVRMVPIFFLIEQPYTVASHDEAYKQLLAVSREFLSGVDLTELSRRYQ